MPGGPPPGRHRPRRLEWGLAAFREGGGAAGAMGRQTVLCFARAYGPAAASELSRFAVRGAARWYLTVGLTALGWVVQTAYLADLTWTGRRVPITTEFESLLVLSWIFAAIALYLMVRAPKP